MAKKLLEFEEEFIDIYVIKTISKKQYYCDKAKKMKFAIDINGKMPESSKNPLPVYLFPYATENLRDEKLELLRMQLEEVEEITFL